MDANVDKVFVVFVIRPNGLEPAAITPIGEFTSESNALRWIEKEAPCLGEYQYYAVFQVWKKTF